MRYSVPASRNGIPIKANPSRNPNPTYTTQATSSLKPVSSAVAAMFKSHTRSYAKPAVLSVNAKTSASTAAVASHSPISGVRLARPITPAPRRGSGPGAVQPGITGATVKTPVRTR